MTSNLFSKPDSVLVPFDMNSQFDERYTIGVDLGQSNDSTAIAVVRKIERFPDKPIFQVGHLSRVALGTPYPAIVVHAMDILLRPRFLGKTDLCIDITGVGKPCFDLFQGYGITPIGILITGGDSTSRDGSIWRVPKINLVSRLQALLHDQRLHIHKDIPDATALVGELQNFRAEYSDSGYIRFNARSGKHDDLVLALAIALWRSNGDGEATFNNWIEFARRQNPGMCPAQPTKQTAMLKLQRPPNSSVSNVSTLKSRNILVPESGVIEVDTEESISLLQAGWQQVETAP
jgi:hypothetical protein